MASLPRWVERAIEDTPFSDMRAVDAGFEREFEMSQTSGCNPGLYTNYKTKATKSKPKSKGK